MLASDTYSKDPEAGSSGTVATYSTMGTLKPDAAAVTGAGAGWTGESKGETGTYDQKDYVYSADMTLANKSTNKIDIDATVTISWTVSTDTIKFLRVGFLVGSSNEGTWSYKFVSLGNDIASGEGSAITTGTNYVYDATKSTVTVEYSKLIDEFDGNTVRTITFLAWFDGNDSECYVDNAISVSELNLSVEYNAVKPNESGD